MGTVRYLWLRWKMLPLPWRKKFFVGQDLGGNTFWEFRDPITKHRLRRIVHRSPYSPKSHYADIQITPQWHQWLRQTRVEAPTIAEQQADIMRQSQLKMNAKLADERWERKARYIEKPAATASSLPQPQKVLKDDVRLDAAQAVMEAAESGKTYNPGQNMKSAVGDQGHVDEMSKGQLNSQAQTQTRPTTQTDARTTSGPNTGAEYQPESWTPGGGNKRSKV